MAQKVTQIEKLQSFGFDIPVEAVLSTVSGVPGRPHIATVLMERNPKHFETRQQIFDEYLGANKKAHVARPFALTVAEAVDLIKQSGGFAVLAHPAIYGQDLDFLVAQAVEAGITGLEIHYPYRDTANRALIPHLEYLAQTHSLIITGGSDYHAHAGIPLNLGDAGLSLAQFKQLRQQFIFSHNN